MEEDRTHKSGYGLVVKMIWIICIILACIMSFAILNYFDLYYQMKFYKTYYDYYVEREKYLKDKSPVILEDKNGKPLIIEPFYPKNEVMF